MDGDENSFRFSSNLPRPNRANSQTRNLQDITATANNASRSMLPPPGSIAGSVARKQPESSEPPSKRKTLMERAGEPRQTHRPGHGSSKSFSASVNSFNTNPAYASSASSRNPSASSRTTSRGSNSSHKGSGMRPPSARGIARPKTAIGCPLGQPASRLRPATAMDGHDDDDEQDSILGKRKVQAWDQDAKMEDMNAMFRKFVDQLQGTSSHSESMKEALDLYKSRIETLETKLAETTDHNIKLRVDLDTTKAELSRAEASITELAREHEISADDVDRKHRVEAESIRQEAHRQIDVITQKHEGEIRELRRRFDAELDDERAQRLRDMNQLNAQSAMDNQQRQAEVVRKDAELQASKSELEQLRRDLEHERTVNKELQNNLAVSSTNSMTLESSIRALKARIEFLESGNKEQSDAFARLDQELREALEETQATQEKLRKEETLRRKLHNQVQELKGNIRVFCRVRPLLESDTVEDAATIQFPDSNAESREITVQGPEERSALGNITTKNHAFSFDHVFAPSSQNVHVFDEISQLVQSALDGYNVCIFCYGQTGSGKTHTMSSDDGMIPRAVHQIYDTAKSLEEKGWTYTMEGNFVEVYNENLNDLLGKADELDKKKHEIRHDMQKCKTTITDVTTVTLDSPARVETILRRAAANRSVAATKANERSSRSHSVFILKLIGKNSITGERSEGTLNLVDLAGSERLSHSGSTGERLKETQSINRSLSCLGDVIGALGQGKEGAHIPYRNSKLTYLLQFSLSGNSKTLMFVMVSPRLSHLGETLTSLKFATKVHNTHIGTAKRQARVRDS